MYSSPYESPLGSGYPHGSDPDPDPGPSRPSLLRMVVAAVLIGVVASILFGSALGAIGVVFHIVGVVVRLAILVALGTFIWRRVTRHRGCGRRI